MTLADEINRMVRRVLEGTRWSSAGDSGRPINFIVEFGPEDTPDLEAMIREGAEDTESSKQSKQVDETVKKVGVWDKGNIGDVQRFTSSQFGNLKEFVANPAQFMIQTVLGRFAKGAGIFALALVIFEAVKWIIGELLKPGRLLDLRFKRIAQDEILFFRKREDQQRLKQGFSNIIITTTPRLRGGQGQTVNTLDFAAGRGKFPDNSVPSSMLLESAGPSLSKVKGAGRRNFGRR